MARSLSLSLSLSLSRNWPTKSLRPTASRLLALRAQSTHNPNHADNLSDIEASSDPLLRKLEDAIHRIIVRRSAPDWLPFLPGSSYWVPPPRSQSYGMAQLVEKLANPLTPDQSLSTTTVRGWPSSDYFIKGTHPHPLEGETTLNNVPHCQSEDEEG